MNKVENHIEKTKERSPVVLWILVFLLFLIGLAALISGPMLFLAPDGHLLQWSVSMLEGTPFANFLVPGVILFLLIGIFPVFVGYGLLKKPFWRWPDRINPLKQYHWSFSASWAVGIIILIWIITETVLLGYISVLQPIVGAWGVTLIILTLLPPIRRYCRRYS
ncbi:MAG TPA: hypothetical protein VLH15_11050 [Dehalococcoidales bacterium]|nr:hypothetical protein [Dehalococcoidales bacterium]